MNIQDCEAAATLLITRHAVRRYVERARITMPARGVESELRRQVLEALASGSLLCTGAGTHVVPFRARHRAWLCLVLRLAWHAGECRIVVCTVLTQAMALRTFGHVTGLITAMSEQPHRSAAA